MNFSSYGKKIIELANKTCDIVRTTQGRIPGTTQNGDIDTPLFTTIPCRYEQKVFSKFHPISQMVEVSSISGVFYFPVDHNAVQVLLEAQKDIVVFEGNRYEILFVEIPSMPVYVKVYIRRK